MRINNGQIIQTFGKKITIFDGEKSVLLTFNTSASFIFNQIKKGTKRTDIVKNLTKKYKITQETAQKDFDEFIKQLKKRGIIF